MSLFFTLPDVAFWAFQVLHALCTALLTAAVMRILRTPTKRDQRLAQLESDQADLILRIQKLQGRLGRQIRDERAATDDADANEETFAQRRGETPDAWKLRTRALLQRGVKPKIG